MFPVRDKNNNIPHLINDSLHEGHKVILMFSAATYQFKSERVGSSQWEGRVPFHCLKRQVGTVERRGEWVRLSGGKTGWFLPKSALYLI